MGSVPIFVCQMGLKPPRFLSHDELSTVWWCRLSYPSRLQPDDADSRSNTLDTRNPNLGFEDQKEQETCGSVRISVLKFNLHILVCPTYCLCKHWILYWYFMTSVLSKPPFSAPKFQNYSGWFATILLLIECPRQHSWQSFFLPDFLPVNSFLEDLQKKPHIPTIPKQKLPPARN